MAGLRPGRVVLGVSGGIAAYKACSVLRLLVEDGHEVRVVPTPAALRFVGEATWAALSRQPVTTDVWTDVHEVPHVSIGRSADLVVVAPATADLLARAAHGLADDLLTSTLLTAGCPVLMAPAMHTEMLRHPATRANVATLRERGVVVLEPAVGRLTGADSGPGRLPEPETIVTAARRLLSRGPAPADLTGRRVVISAGGTREPLDPVRYLGNRSSGRQGVALATSAVARGAGVTLVAAAMDVEPPAGVEVVRVETALELREAVLAAAGGADAVVMAAAVADFRPATVSPFKIKKDREAAADDGGAATSGVETFGAGEVAGAAGDPAGDAPTVRLVRNPDVLAELSARRPREQVVVGFAAETGDAEGDVLDHARRKFARKGCDLLVVNDVSGGRVFGERRTQVVLLRPDGSLTEVPEGTKEDVSDAVWDEVVKLLPPAGGGRNDQGTAQRSDR